jgi:uncharacterized protein YutE (UPF0331/DUF86 family)
VTDADLVAKKLAEIESYLGQLRSLARLDRLTTDLKEERFVCHTLQLAVQAVLDVASHVVSDERLGEPANLRELFELLAQGGWLAADQVPALQRMVGFRNLLVHEYGRVNLAIVREVVENRLGDLEGFVGAVRAKASDGVWS